MKVEICINCDTQQHLIASAQAAQLGGASTIELCRAMDQDGLTPLPNHIAAARATFQQSGLMVMVRPRAGGFIYTDAELVEMRAQIVAAANAGADGVVFGALQPDGEIAQSAVAELGELCHTHRLTTTFHRAFDATPDSSRTLDQLINLNIDRVLTSGTPWGSGLSALQGITQLKRLVAQASDRIEVVIGGGVSSVNAPVLLSGIGATKNKLSLHAYSSVLKDGVAFRPKIADLVAASQATTTQA